MTVVSIGGNFGMWWLAGWILSPSASFQQGFLRTPLEGGRVRILGEGTVVLERFGDSLIVTAVCRLCVMLGQVSTTGQESMCL